MRKQQLKSAQGEVNRYFSEEFIKAKVRELERKVVGVSELSREYKVSRAAIYKWIDKFSSMKKKKERLVYETDSDTRKLQAFRERQKELEQAVGQKQMQIELLEKMIQLAEEAYGIEIKKNFFIQPSSGSGKTAKPKKEK